MTCMYFQEKIPSSLLVPVNTNMINKLLVSPDDELLDRSTVSDCESPMGSADSDIFVIRLGFGRWAWAFDMFVSIASPLQSPLLLVALSFPFPFFSSLSYHLQVPRYYPLVPRLDSPDQRASLTTRC